MGNTYMEASQINYRGDESRKSVEQKLKETSGEAAAIAALQADVWNLQSGKANLSVIAPAFSAEAAYDPGDLVYYNGITYRCVNAHEGEWDADDFAATTISNELDELKSGLTNLVMYVEGGDNNFGTIAAEGVVHKRYTLTAVSGYHLVSANAHLNYADVAEVSCQITDDTTIDVFARNWANYDITDQVLYYKLLYVKSTT